MMRLALGTVQFGLDYGIKNERGKVPRNEVKSILDLARKHGVDTVDTAAAYGDSESVLGSLVGDWPDLKIVTKLPAHSSRSVRQNLESSLERLGRSSVDGYLIHSFEDWQRENALMDQLVACRESGLVNKIGISLYRPEEAKILMNKGVPLDLVQVPYSLLDRRFESVFEQLTDYGTEIHVRSVFLQGVFFIRPSNLHPRFSSIAKILEKVQRLAEENGMSVAALCLGLAVARPEISRIVLGADSLADLESSISAYMRTDQSMKLLDQLGDIRSNDENVILPFKWNDA